MNQLEELGWILLFAIGALSHYAAYGSVFGIGG